MDKTLVEFPDDVIKYIVGQYTDEEGVRSLKRGINSILSQLNIIRVIDDPDKTKLFISSITKPIKFPFQLTNSYVDKFLKNSRKKDDYFKLMMYS